MGDREGMVKRMWDLYTSSHQIRLAQFWREAFEAAFEDMTNESPGIREAAISEIAKMSLHYITVHSPPVQTTVGILIMFSFLENTIRCSTSNWLSIHPFM